MLPLSLIFKGVIVAVHLLIVDALNLFVAFMPFRDRPVSKPASMRRSAHYAQPANPRGRRF